MITRIPSLLGFILIMACLNSCSKETEEGIPSPSPQLYASEQEVYESFVMLNSAYDRLIMEGPNYNGDAEAALVAVSDWVNQQEGVSEAFVYDYYYLTIRYDSGLENRVIIDFKDENGFSLNRGSGSGPGYLHERLSSVLGSGCSDIMENPKVLFFEAQEFIGVPLAIVEFTQMMNDHPYPFDVTHLEGQECTPDALLTFGEYGLVIIDTHGIENATQSGLSFSYLLDASDSSVDLGEALISALGESNYERIRRGELLLSTKAPVELGLTDWYLDPIVTENFGHEIWISESFIRTLSGVENTIILNNSCNSGMTLPDEKFPKPIGSAYLSTSPLVYYGWQLPDGSSHPIGDPKAKEFSQSFIERLLDSDSTGIAHLQLNGDQWPSYPISSDPRVLEFLTFLEQFENETYCYDVGCQSEPLEDDRDGRIYPTVCINGQVWMAENLKYEGAGLCYEFSSANCESEGRLYSIQELTGLQNSNSGNTIQGLCPQGWHVPAKWEFEQLIDYLGGTSEAGRILASETEWPEELMPTDSLDFNLVPNRNGIYDGLTDMEQEWEDIATSQFLLGSSQLWTSTYPPGALGSNDFRTIRIDANQSPAFNIFYGSSWTGNEENFRQLPCRCVKD